MPCCLLAGGTGPMERALSAETGGEAPPPSYAAMTLIAGGIRLPGRSPGLRRGTRHRRLEHRAARPALHGEGDGRRRAGDVGGEVAVGSTPTSSRSPGTAGPSLRVQCRTVACGPARDRGVAHVVIETGAGREDAAASMTRSPRTSVTQGAQKGLGAAALASRRRQLASRRPRTLVLHVARAPPKLASGSCSCRTPRC